MSTKIDLTSIFTTEAAEWQGSDFSQYSPEVLFSVAKMIESNPNAIYTVGGVVIDTSSFLRMYCKENMSLMWPTVLDPFMPVFSMIGEKDDRECVTPVTLSVELDLSIESANFLLWFHINSPFSVYSLIGREIKDVSPVLMMGHHVHVFSDPNIWFVNDDQVAVNLRVVTGIEEAMMDDGQLLPAVVTVTDGRSKYALSNRFGVDKFDWCDELVFEKGLSLCRESNKPGNFFINGVKYAFDTTVCVLSICVRTGKFLRGIQTKLHKYPPLYDVRFSRIRHGRRNVGNDLQCNSAINLRELYMSKRITQYGYQRGTASVMLDAKNYRDYVHYVRTDWAGGVSVREVVRRSRLEAMRRIFGVVEITDYLPPFHPHDLVRKSWLYETLCRAMDDMIVTYDAGRCKIVSESDGNRVELEVDYDSIPGDMREGLFIEDRRFISHLQYFEFVDTEGKGW